MSGGPRPPPATRADYRWFLSMPTRWMDNDAYGHVNNVVYYSWFDTAVNRYLIEAGALDVQRSPVIGLVIETRCNYFAPLEFPQTVDAGLRVGHVGRSSVRYEVGLFAAGEASGFGGGGMHGNNALEGTFLGGCIFSGMRAGRGMAGVAEPLD